VILGFVSGVILDVIYFFLRFQSKDVIPHLGETKEKPWNLLDVTKAVILYFSFLAIIRLIFCNWFLSLYLFLLSYL